MPLHDWTRVDAGLFYAFHHGWIEELARALNRGLLPPDYFALPEQNIRGPIPDALALRFAEVVGYARKASHVTVHHGRGRVVAVIEIVSPGNKASRAEFRAVVEKSVDLIRQGIHLLVIDVFPPGPRDPQGIHQAIWEEFQDDDFVLPVDKPLTLASYDAGEDVVAYAEFVAAGDALPDMPLFLRSEVYVEVPLEASYRSSWSVFPAALKGLLE